MKYVWTELCVQVWWSHLWFVMFLRAAGCQSQHAPSMRQLQHGETCSIDFTLFIKGGLPEVYTCNTLTQIHEWLWPAVCSYARSTWRHSSVPCSVAPLTVAVGAERRVLHINFPHLAFFPAGHRSFQTSRHKPTSSTYKPPSTPETESVLLESNMAQKKWRIWHGNMTEKKSIKNSQTNHQNRMTLLSHFNIFQAGLLKDNDCGESKTSFTMSPRVFCTSLDKWEVIMQQFKIFH